MKFTPVFKCEACGLTQPGDEVDIRHVPNSPNGWAIIHNTATVCDGCAAEWSDSIQRAFDQFMREKNKIIKRNEELEQKMLEEYGLWKDQQVAK